MSAIAGIWRLDARPDAGQACGRMLDALAPYGPHASGLWEEDVIALGRRLHRTVPEDAFDHQPLSGGDGALRLVADLRLDNRGDLAVDLGLRPEDARRMCDAALLLAAWERWEDGCFDHLVGDYAFALFDRRRRRLVLARDPMGRRPLFHHQGQGFFAFATMAKGLHALPEVPYGPDEDQAAELLALLPAAATRSFFKDVCRVEPGTLLAVTDQGLSTRRHWNPRRDTLRLAGAGDYAEGLRHHLDQAVTAQLRGAGRAVGAHLSGGLDSAGVAATAARLMAPSGGRVTAFTAVPRPGYDAALPRGRFGDEGPLAAATAAMYGNIEHVKIASGERSPLAGLDRSFFLFEQPMLNLCNAVWVDAINDAARQRGLSILLTGQSGNLTLSYDGATLLPELLTQGRLARLAREGWGLMRHGGMSLPGVLMASFGPWMPAALWDGLHRAFGRGRKDTFGHSAIDPGRLAELGLPARARERGLDPSYRPRKDGFETRLWGLGRVDQGAYIKGTLAGWALDLRDPTADRRLLEFCLSVPAEQWLADGVRRKLGRLALADRLPVLVVNQRDRGLQAVDWHEGATAARGEIAGEVERLAANAGAARALDMDRMRRLVAAWPEGGWHGDEVMGGYRLALLRGISVGHFLRRTSGGNR
ncbi:MAG: asparagine synthetase B family protein [Phenylobacterium sp.]